MAIRFRCPCGQKLKTRDGTEGRHARCSSCLSLLRIPADGASTYETVAEPYTPHSKDTHAEGAPAAGAAAPDAAPESAEVPASPHSVKARILVADSNAEDRRSIARILENHDYFVLEAADGPKALEMIRAERPAAVLLSVKLDVMSGFQVVQQLRSPANILDKDVWDTPVLMTTDRLLGRDKQYSMSIGAHGYYVKPLQPAQICPKGLEKIAAKHRPH